MVSAVASPTAAAACPLCHRAAPLLHPGRGGPALPASEDRYTIARFEYGTPFPVRRCALCALSWAELPFDAERVLGAYVHAADAEYLEEERARRRTFRRALLELRARLDGEAEPRLLDVGAAAGFLLVEARDLGFRAVGLEPSAWAAARTRERFGVEVLESGLESAPLPSASFSVVTLVDVIEHLFDPFAGLRQAARLLRPGGLLYLVTPDGASLTARLLGRRWWGYEPWHLWYFSAASLHAALRDAGLEIVQMRRYRRSFSLGYWLRKAEGLCRPAAAPLAALARWTGASRLLLGLDLHDSLEVVARRKADA